MWCIGDLTSEYVQRMYNLIDLYSIEYSEDNPVICIDEKSKQMIADSDKRTPINIKKGEFKKIDYEYKRNGTVNLFVSVEPKGGNHFVQVTERRTKEDFVNFILTLVNEKYANAKIIHIVMDNLNTHFKKSFDDILGVEKSNHFFERVQFHHTPKHASWLNMAEIEIGILDRQCLDRRLPDRQTLEAEVKAWQDKRNEDGCTINWKFTREMADQKLSRHYVS
jgi:hypothetical protein